MVLITKTTKTTAVLVLLLAYGLYPLLTTTNNGGIADLIRGTDPLLDNIIQKMPSLSKGPLPPIFLHNKHLQFIPFLLQNEYHRIQGIPYQRLELEVTACLDKSEGRHCLPSPLMNDTISLDIFPPLNKNETIYTGFSDASPIIIFMPGLRCHSMDMPGNSIIRRLYGEGFRSVVINRRGHTPTQPLRAPRWNLFGDVPDLEQTYWYIRKQLVAPDTPMFLHGISSGTAVVVSALAEFDHRRDVLGEGTTTPSFVASISITPGYDTSKVLLPTRFQFPYNNILTQSVKDHFIIQNEVVLREFNSPAVDAALQATHLQEFVNAVAPFSGYPNSSSYYDGENPINHLHRITTPKLVINSNDDPCCHIDNLYEQSSQRAHQGKTYAQLISESLRGMVVVTHFGSHCPFLDSGYGGLWPKVVRDPLYGGWMLDSWADRVSVEYYKATLEIYSHRRYY